MTNKEALEGLKYLIGGESNQYPPDYDMHIQVAIKTLELTQWISVKDELPDNDSPVLCWYEYYRYGEYNRMHQTYGIGYCINGYWGGEVSNGTQAKVLYWMHLPEPPKEELNNGALDN